MFRILIFKSFPADCVTMLCLVVGLERFNDLWDYAVEPLIPDRSKVRFQTKRDKGGLRRAQAVECRCRNASAHQT